jgi:predicted amidohydrolase YtcJ
MNKNTIIAIACVALVVAGAFVCCGSMINKDTNAADTVVYGKIYTSNATGDYAEAIAVKDGKYVYVGDEDGVKSYVGNNTKVVDYRNKGLIIAGATEGHGHYAMEGVLLALGLSVTGDTKEEILANVTKYVEDNPDSEVYYSFGWNNIKMTATKATIDMRSELDKICSDKPMLITDDSGHNGFCNSKAFELAGVTKDTVITGGEFYKDATTGELIGLASDMAYNYVLKTVMGNTFKIAEKDYAKVSQTMEESLHKNGYTYYQDGWLNYFGSEAIDCLTEYDKTTGLTIYVGGSYKIDSYEDWEKEIDNAVKYMGKYSTDHLVFKTIKLFADGEAVESGSGWMKEEYVSGGYGTQVWSDEVMYALVKAANEKGLSVHVHAQGDAASEQVVNAFINAESTAKDGVYNGICHARNITDETKKKMGEHNIYAAVNINWRTLIDKSIGDQLVSQLLREDVAKAGYPIKSLIENGVNISSSTDVPAASGAPITVCGIIEVAVNDTCADKDVWQLDPAERVTVEQAIDIMTINGAKQLQIDDTRGSIEVGKYADFLLLDKDITTCDADKIHEGNVASVYFEGKECYTLEA